MGSIYQTGKMSGQKSVILISYLFSYFFCVFFPLVFVFFPMFFLFVSYYSLFFRNFPEVFANIQLSRNFSKNSEFIITGFCPPIFPFFLMSLLFWSIFNNFTISLIYNACPEYANITLVHTYIIYRYIYNIHICITQYISNSS